MSLLKVAQSIFFISCFKTSFIKINIASETTFIRALEVGEFEPPKIIIWQQKLRHTPVHKIRSKDVHCSIVNMLRCFFQLELCRVEIINFYRMRHLLFVEFNINRSHIISRRVDSTRDNATSVAITWTSVFKLGVKVFALIREK